MIRLYHSPNARSFRALWALEELGLPYELVHAPFPPRERVPGYLEVNPLGTVPAFYDGDALMTESAAIPHYLATRYGPSPMAVAPEEPAYPAYLNFLHMGEATLTFPQTIVLRYTRLEPEPRRLPQAVEDYSRWFNARFKAAAPLMGETFVCADRFTAADISVGYATMLAESLGIADRLPEKVREHLVRMREREAFQRALEAQKKP